MSDPWPPIPPQPPDSAADTSPVGSHADPASQDDAPPSSNRRALVIAGLAVLGFMVIAVLVGGGARPAGSATFPPAGATTGPAGGAVAATRGDVARALSAQGLQSEESTRPYRPAEAPAFATAPRILLRAILPDDPDHGLIVIYEFSSPGAATAAAEEQAAYIATGVGRVQFPPDSRYVIRVVGSTAVFFAWSPANAADPRTPSIGTALETVGLGIPVPN